MLYSILSFKSESYKSAPRGHVEEPWNSAKTISSLTSTRTNS